MISRDLWRRLEPILDTALDLSSDEVDAYLRRSCSGHPEMREEVERLIAVVQRSPEAVGFLDSPPFALAAQVLADPEADLDLSMADDLEEGVSVGPYRIVRPLGRGGMGVVYLARDPRLDRLVALKLLPPWIAADESMARRLQEEARAASALDHPNIETVYDVGTTEEHRPYFAMAYYEGETLAERIRKGPLPVADAVAVATQVARGLEAAHSLGIVHRDIKPANVIVTPDGLAKILDFGLAGGAQAAYRGAALGTVSYMSPEQTVGSTDPLTDVWGLGVVLYEMLAGRRPFVGGGRAAVTDAIRNDEPVPLREVRPDVPGTLAKLVHRCLAKDPEARFADAASLAQALALCAEQLREPRVRGRVRRYAVPLGLSLLVVVAAVVGVVLRDTGRPSTPGIPSVAGARLAVFPLSDAGLESEDAYLAGGLTAELTELLAKSPDLSVITPGSGAPGDRTEAGAARIAREMGVDALLRGDLRSSPQGVQLSLKLIDVGSLGEIWGARYTAEPGQLATLQADVATHVSKALGAPEIMRGPWSDGTAVDEAYTEYLKGRYYLDRLEPASTADARDHFQRALDLDPTFASAWSGLSGAYNQMWTYGLLPADEAGPRARAAAERALELDPESAEGYEHLAAVLGWYYGDMAAAESNERHALELEPSSARVYRHYAVHLRDRGRFDEALEAVHRASELEPLSPGNYRVEGMILYMARRYQEAVQKYEDLLLVDPRDTPARVYIALARAQMGRLDEALAELRDVDPDERQVEAVSIRGYVFGRLEREDEARRVLSRLDELSPAPAALSFFKATVLVGLGEHEAALDMLEQAVDAHGTHVGILEVEPVFDPLRDDARFQALLERLGLAGQ